MLTDKPFQAAFAENLIMKLARHEFAAILHNDHKLRY
jgi:hypothetical protein